MSSPEDRLAVDRLKPSDEIIVMIVYNGKREHGMIEALCEPVVIAFTHPEELSDGVESMDALVDVVALFDELALKSDGGPSIDENRSGIDVSTHENESYNRTEILRSRDALASANLPHAIVFVLVEATADAVIQRESLSHGKTLHSLSRGAGLPPPIDFSGSPQKLPGKSIGRRRRSWRRHPFRLRNGLLAIQAIYGPRRDRGDISRVAESTGRKRLLSR